MKKISLRLLLLLFVVWLPSSCGYREESFNLGRGEKICPPKEYLPRDVWFLPKDKVGASDGFSFMGCGFVRQKGDKPCLLPGELISANVEPSKERRSISWGELKSSADYRTLINAPGSSYSLDVATGFYVLSNKSVQNSWSIWKRGDVVADNGSPMIDDSDVLVATCYDIKDYPGGAGRLADEGGFACSRYARGQDYALNYEFLSRRPIPPAADVRALDSKLFRQVYSWRCRKYS